MPEAHSLCPRGPRPEGPEGSYFAYASGLAQEVLKLRIITFL